MRKRQIAKARTWKPIHRIYYTTTARIHAPAAVYGELALSVNGWPDGPNGDYFSMTTERLHELVSNNRFSTEARDFLQDVVSTLNRKGHQGDVSFHQ